MKKTFLKKIGTSESSKSKRRIQALLREIAIKRDGGCILRIVLGGCNAVLQAEHLLTRSNTATFGDTRNIVCLCSYHHIFWKPKNSKQYWELIEQHIGPTRWAWLKLAEEDKSPHKVDLKLVEIALQRELEQLHQNS